ATDVVWRRHARARRVSLRIDHRAGRVIVTLPNRAGRPAGMALLMTHADWVRERLSALPEATPFADDALVPLHGVPHRIRHILGLRGGTRAEAGELLVGGEPAFLARRVADFLRAEALRSLRALVAAKERPAGRTATRVTVKDTRSRWGSCSAQGAISFSWRLVMAPPFVQDYVAAHEVAHLVHMNHGARFWALVTALTPHTAPALAWLRREGARLGRIG
ncbi:MAG: M48 family metallopeptidase, partial [Acetobacteraceae bacterium]